MINLDISKPYFSIIIPTYNSEATLKRCIESIIHQSFVNFEILIVDGASNDRTFDVAVKFHDSRIRIKSEPDKGIYEAMNKGIGMALGQWIYFLGSDDTFYDENVLRRIYNVTLTSDKEVVYGNVRVIGDPIWASDGTIYDGYFSLEKLISKNICHQALFYKSIVFSKLGYFNTDFIVCADWDYNLKCRAKYNFEYVDIIVANFQGGGSGDTLKDDKYSTFECVVKYYKWQFFKEDLRPYLIRLFKYAIKKGKIDIVLIICPQIVISYFNKFFNRQQKVK